MQCELCGKETNLFKALVEGTELTVCQSCGSHGKILRPAISAVQSKKIKKAKSKPQLPEEIDTIVADYAAQIRKAREKQGLTQKEFAKKLNIKESLLHKLESTGFELGFDLAHKLERLLNITLVVKEKIESQVKGSQKSKSEGLTIGDLIKF